MKLSVSVSTLSYPLAATLISQCLAVRFGSQQPQEPLLSEPLGKSIKWESCGELSNHTVECSRIDVPMDHFNKGSNKTFSIPLIRMLGSNTSSTDRKTILLNPGGPGGSGINFLWRGGAAINKMVGDDFDLLSFDPRGVNGSIPIASCYPTPEQRAADFESNVWNVLYEAGEMYTRAENKAKACADTMGEMGAYINTPQTAADMNTILDAIGQEEMYYWGFSYGTTLGQTYAQLFPERVTRLIIDGVSNLDYWYNTYYDEESLVDTDRLFVGLVEECFKAGENCPLNFIKDQTFKSAGELKTYIDAFLEKLEDEPIPVYLNNSNYGAVTRRSVVTNGIFPALYKPVAWPILAKNLADLLSGNATSVFNAYSDNWVSAILSDETNAFVVTNDNWKSGAAAPVHGIRAIQNYSLAYLGQSELISKYGSSDAFDRASWSIPTTHSFHPQYHPEYPRFKTANPILVLSTTYDPVCPLISAKKAHNSFEGAGFLEQKSYGHCSISMPSLCTAKHVRAYFSEGTLPDEGSTCDIDGTYFPAPGKRSTDERKALSTEDAELMAALEELASVGLFDNQPFRRRLGI